MANNPTYTDHILIDLDCIMDVRLSIILDMSGGDLDSIGFNMQAWVERTSDLVIEWADSTKIDQSEFDKRVKARNITDLPAAPLTNALVSIATMIENAEVAGAVNKMRQDVGVVVNYYPYDLNEAQLDVFQFAWEKYFDGAVTIYMVSTPLIWLTPRHLQENYTQYIRYHGEDWLQEHGELLSTDRIPSFKMTIPFSYLSPPEKDGPPAEEEARRVSFGIASALSLDIIPLEGMSIDYDLMGMEKA